MIENTEGLFPHTSCGFYKAALAAEKLALACREFAKVLYDGWDGNTPDGELAKLMERLLHDSRLAREDLDALVKGFNDGCAGVTGLLGSAYENLGHAGG